jgi:hypothetical protein
VRVAEVDRQAYSNIMERADYGHFPSFWDDPDLRKWNLRSYVDASHVGQSTRRALEAEITGADAFIIAAADTVMRQPSRRLMEQVYLGVPVRRDLGEHETPARDGQGASRARLRTDVHLAQSPLRPSAG